ncbi:MAG: VWA domain-containing protein [Stutzerimonas stutzeri]
MFIDVSGSMLTRDLKPNRLEALKRVASELVEARPNDGIRSGCLCSRKLYQNAGYQ